MFECLLQKAHLMFVLKSQDFRRESSIFPLNLLQKFADGKPFIDTSLLLSTINLGNVVLESAYHDNYVSHALCKALAKPLADRKGFIKEGVAMIGPVLTSINNLRGTAEARPPRGLSRLQYFWSNCKRTIEVGLTIGANSD